MLTEEINQDMSSYEVNPPRCRYCHDVRVWENEVQLPSYTKLYEPEDPSPYFWEKMPAQKLIIKEQCPYCVGGKYDCND